MHFLTFQKVNVECKITYRERLILYLESGATSNCGIKKQMHFIQPTQSEISCYRVTF